MVRHKQPSSAAVGMFLTSLLIRVRPAWLALSLTAKQQLRDILTQTVIQKTTVTISFSFLPQQLRPLPLFPFHYCPFCLLCGDFCIEGRTAKVNKLAKLGLQQRVWLAASRHQPQSNRHNQCHVTGAMKTMLRSMLLVKIMSFPCTIASSAKYNKRVEDSNMKM